MPDRRLQDLQAATDVQPADLLYGTQSGQSRKFTVAQIRGRADWYIDPRDFGAAFDNETDDTAAMQAAIDSLGSTVTARGGRVILPKGTAVISDTLLIERRAVMMEGQGWGPTGSSDGTTFRWTGHNDRPMIRVREGMGSKFSDFRLLGNPDTAHRPTAGIELHVEHATQRQPNSYMTFNRVWFGRFAGYDSPADDLGAGGDYLTAGLATAGASALDNLQNDMSRIAGCVFYQVGTGYKTAAWNTQAVLNKIESCAFYYCGTGVFSVAQTMLDNVYFAWSSICDLHIQQDRFTCWNYTSEYARQMAKIEPNGELFVHTGYFQVGHNLRDDGRIIDAINDTRTVIELTAFDFRENEDYATTHRGVPAVLAIKAATNGTLAHKVLGLHHVNYGIGGMRQAFGPAHLEIDPGRKGQGLDDLTIYGELQGPPDASGQGITRPFYNYLHSKNPVPDFCTDQRMQQGLAIPRIKAGPPTDADYPNPPADGTMVIDSTQGKLYVRLKGAWRSAALS